VQVMSHPSYGMDIPAAHPRPRPPKSLTSDAPRESGALRTSVWETVLQLGLGMNPIVADWIFDNQLAEEGEVRTISISFPQKSWTPAFEFFNRGHACILTAYVIHLIATTLRSTFLVQALIFAPFFRVALCFSYGL